MSKKASARKASAALQEALAYFRPETARPADQRDATASALDQMYAYYG